MQVIIAPQVHQIIEEFYEHALLNHETYDEISVIRKVDRLYDALEKIGKFARIHPKARLKKEWILNDYYESITEDFHFAYYIAEDEDGNEVAIIVDACHSLLYHK